MTEPIRFTLDGEEVEALAHYLASLTPR